MWIPQNCIANSPPGRPDELVIRTGSNHAIRAHLMRAEVTLTGLGANSGADQTRWHQLGIPDQLVRDRSQDPRSAAHRSRHSIAAPVRSARPRALARRVRAPARWTWRCSRLAAATGSPMEGSLRPPLIAAHAGLCRSGGGAPVAAAVVVSEVMEDRRFGGMRVVSLTKSRPSPCCSPVMASRWWLSCGLCMQRVRSEAVDASSNLLGLWA
jgi:hypothetical protein